MDVVPNADTFGDVRKKGYLQKLIGKGWLFPGTWKRRYCVLEGSCFYYYENEGSKGGDKTSGVISLETYDVCEEWEDNKNRCTQDKKSAVQNAFYIGTMARGFFDNRHYLAAENEVEMQDWIHSVHKSISDTQPLSATRNRSTKSSRTEAPQHIIATNGNNIGNNLPGINTQGPEDIELEDSDDNVTQRLVSATKDRVRGPQGRKLPQRGSYVPKQVSDKDDDIRKLKSLSVYCSNLSELEDHSEDLRKRISVSMEEMDREIHIAPDDDEGQRSSSSDDVNCRLINQEGSPASTNLARRAGFGKLGIQQAALAKELEMKFKKTALPPGGLRFPKLKRDSSTRQSQEAEAFEKIMESLDTRVQIMINSIDLLEPRVEGLKSMAKTPTEDGVCTRALDCLKQASSTLKESSKVNSECKQVLEDAKRLRDEYQRLLKQVNVPKSNNGVEVIPVQST